MAGIAGESSGERGQEEGEDARAKNRASPRASAELDSGEGGGEGGASRGEEETMALQETKQTARKEDKERMRVRMNHTSDTNATKE